MATILEILAAETAGKSYRALKYELDTEVRSPYGHGEVNGQWQKTAETRPSRAYVDLSFVLNNQGFKESEPIFKYFLDGSRRVFKIDDMAYRHARDRSVLYPIIAGQIGVGCLKRVDKRMSVERYIGEIVLAVPALADPNNVPGFFEGLAKKMNETADRFQRVNCSLSKILRYKTAKAAKSDDVKYEDLGIACVQDRMIEQEKVMVATLVRENKLRDDAFLVKDGSLEYRPDVRDDKQKALRFRNNYRWVIGVSKKFNPEVCLDAKGKPNPGFIADLPLYQRTPVAEYTNAYLGDTKYAVWYVRLREQKRTRTAFDGIVKIEKILVTKDELEYGMDSDLVDLISASIINERNPTCYGSDTRWANHIYPIYLTEEFVKSRYMSADSFVNLF